MSTPNRANSLDEMVRLSTRVTIKNYREMVNQKNRDAIADFLYERLSERYVMPVKFGTKNGFAMMACGCLLIETLEAFWNGWKTSNGAGPVEVVFRQFFGRTKRLVGFEKYASDFYEGVRCGILHQGETKGGWRITRKRNRPVLSVDGTKTIQAVKFLNRLDASLRDYCRNLKSEDWREERWRNVRRKMDHIIRNCEEKP